MKVALVHDYIKEFGGAERVLMALHQMFPEAPIYTAFVAKGSTCEQTFLRVGAKLIPSWLNFLLRHRNLHSPFRFLIPLVWESFDFSEYDLVILSSSGYITKPVRIPKGVKVICYCHTPPRFLWGYQISAEWARYPVLKIGSEILAHFLRLYDQMGAKRVDQFVANSETVKARIWKHYRKEAFVVNPPVEVVEIKKQTAGIKREANEKFFLVVSRIVGGKGIPMIMEAFNKLRRQPRFKDFKLKIAGKSTGLQWESRKINAQKAEGIEFLGEVSEVEKIDLMARATAFLAAEQEVDFGITPVEAMAAGTPVVAFASGGYLETVIEGKTGTFFEKYEAESLVKALERLAKLKISKDDCLKQAEKFSKEKFVLEMRKMTKI
jgi:glycosyltransferase involved in cell wall biosynthesis